MAEVAEVAEVFSPAVAAMKVDEQVAAARADTTAKIAKPPPCVSSI